MHTQKCLIHTTPKIAPRKNLPVTPFPPKIGKKQTNNGTIHKIQWPITFPPPYINSHTNTSPHITNLEKSTCQTFFTLFSNPPIKHPLFESFSSSSSSPKPNPNPHSTKHTTMVLKLGLALMMAATAMLASALPTSGASSDMKWVLPMHAPCNGRVGDCIDAEEEMLMESETTKRQLWERNRYISNEAMKKNNIPCNQAGQSYYNCQGNQAANPYRRGCSAITHCARVW